MRTFEAQLAMLTLREAARSRLAWVMLAVLLASFLLAQFLSQVALVEAREIQAALMSALLRISGVFVLASFVISSTVRESNDRITELLLSQAVSRWRYLAGKFIAYAVLACLTAAACALPLLLAATPAAVALWTLAFACELLLVSALGLFCVVSFTQIVPALAATMAAYLLARSISAFQTIAAAPLSGGGKADHAMRFAVDSIALVLPALDRFSAANWLTGDLPAASELAGITVQSAVYLALIGCAALFDLYRKNF